MPYRIVQSKQNARLKELRKAFTRPGRDTHGLVAIEGLHLLQEAVRAGMRLKTVFLRMGSEDVGVFGDDNSGIETLFVPADIFDSVVQTETPQPVAALVEMPDWTWAHVVRGRGAWDPLVLVLAGIQDPGNFGTILRSAEAFGATGVVALPGTVNPWNPKAVRASAGSVFRMPVLSIDVAECIRNLREGGMRILSTTVHGAEPADMINLEGPVALVIGSEAKGVPEAIAHHADAAVTIPCPGPVESLNAAVATSVLLYEACRQRQKAAGGPQQLRGTSR